MEMQVMYFVFSARAGEKHGIAHSAAFPSRHVTSQGSPKLFHLGSRLQGEEALSGLSGVFAKAAEQSLNRSGAQ